MGHKAHHVVEAKFIVMSGNGLDRVVLEGNASVSIKGVRVSITVKVTANNLILSIAQDALKGAV